jgi:hypothetical protein
MNSIFKNTVVFTLMFFSAIAYCDSLSLVSDMAEVINVSDSLKYNRLVLKKLEGIRGVLRVNPDYKAGLLYVVQDTQPNEAMTRVYSLKDLRLIAMLPGVTNVEIPKQSEAKSFITRSYKFSSEYQEMFLSELLQDESQEAVLYEVRDRQSPKKTLARVRELYAVANPLFSLNGTCYRMDKFGFASDSPQRWIAMTLKPQGLSRYEEARSKSFSDHVDDCTSNGAFWLRDYIGKSGDRLLEIRLGAAEGLQRFVVDREPHDFPKVRAIGESAAIVFHEDRTQQLFRVLQVGHKPLDVKPALPMRGASNQLYELGLGKEDDSFYFVGGRRIKGGIRVLSNQVYRLAESKNQWALSPVDLDRVMLMYLEHRRGESTTARAIANGQLITKKPEIRLEGNEEEFRVIGMF